MTLTKNQKIYIGIGGALLVAGVGYYLYTRNSSNVLVEKVEKGVDSIKQLLQADADALAAKMHNIYSKQPIGAYPKSVTDELNSIAKQLKDGGYVIGEYGKAKKQ